MNWKLFIFLLIIIISIVNTKVPVDEITGRSNDVERPKRFLQPIFGFFQAIGNLHRIMKDQYTETKNSIRNVTDIFADTFTDTATKKPPTVLNNKLSGENVTTTTTTEKYRISINEFNQILGRNLRGLQKLYRLEMNDALNQSKYSIAEYEKFKWNKYATNAP